MSIQKDLNRRWWGRLRCWVRAYISSVRDGFDHDDHDYNREGTTLICKYCGHTCELPETVVLFD